MTFVCLHMIKSHMMILYFHFIFPLSETLIIAPSLVNFGSPALISHIPLLNSLTHMACIPLYMDSH